MKILRPLVLSGLVQMSTSARTVPVRPMDASTFGVAWINVDPDTDTVSSILKKIRITSLVDDAIDTQLSDVNGNSLACDATLMAHAAMQNVIVVHADVPPHSKRVAFMSRILQHDDEDIDHLRGNQSEGLEQGSKPSGCSGQDVHDVCVEIPTVPDPGLATCGTCSGLAYAAADKWIRRYGDIVKVNFLGQMLFVVRRATLPARCWLDKTSSLRQRMWAADHMGSLLTAVVTQAAP